MSDQDDPATGESAHTNGCRDASITGGGDDPTDRWIAGPAVLRAGLPDDVRATLGRLLGREPVATLDEWIGAVRRRTGGGSIGVADLCHADGRTPHWGEAGGERYHFRCFYDAVILAALADESVDIRTTSPTGSVIVARAAGTSELSVRPDRAVFSFGVDERVAPPADAGPTAGDVYAAVCPYVRAFSRPDAYRRWAATVPAATVAMPLEEATDLAAALVE